MYTAFEVAFFVWHSAQVSRLSRSTRPPPPVDVVGVVAKIIKVIEPRVFLEGWFKGAPLEVCVSLCVCVCVRACARKRVGMECFLVWPNGSSQRGSGTLALSARLAQAIAANVGSKVSVSASIRTHSRTLPVFGAQLSLQPLASGL